MLGVRFFIFIELIFVYGIDRGGSDCYIGRLKKNSNKEEKCRF